MSVGTPLPACANGRITFIPNNGTGGHTVTINHDDGTSTQYMHCSQFVGANGRYAQEGEVVGMSGGKPGSAGAGQSTGPHLHAHSYVNGQRVPPLYEGMAPAPQPIEEDLMSYSIVKDAQNATIWLVSQITGIRVGISSTYHVDLLTRLKKNMGADPMLVGEIDVCKGYLVLANPPAGLDVDELVARIDAADDDETEAILQAIANIPSGGGGGGASADEIDEKLAPRFDAIPTADENADATVEAFGSALIGDGAVRVTGITAFGLLIALGIAVVLFALLGHVMLALVFGAIGVIVAALGFGVLAVQANRSNRAAAGGRHAG